MPGTGGVAIGITPSRRPVRRAFPAHGSFRVEAIRGRSLFSASRNSSHRAFLTAGCCVSASRRSTNAGGIAASSRCVLDGKDFPKTGKFFPSRTPHEHQIARGHFRKHCRRKIRAEGARRRAVEAVREADRAKAEAWSIRMESYGGPAQPSPTIRQCLNGGLPYLAAGPMPPL
jgi:hypothetical protein